MGFGFVHGFSTITGACVQPAMSWLALFVTGRIFDKFSGTYNSSMKEDALAAFTIVFLTAIAGVMCFFLPILPALVTVIYFGLIYYAFQLQNIIDIAFFYVLHILILNAFSWLVILLGMSMRGEG